ncbi:type VI secretion system membrane subunit TssM [Niveibacterium sp. 24ML]|uniref:type VI secretion system membrane subunit TssM n=1 Tax=Niveibacterium sp. 24ML TaxID=2985512 RepID=UPI002270AD98|nr:type VI secretion system membrane subunit TssM [Niveibacterium sp. 24ML]MCX9156596.1 type VI secretion system membrane subunit TssM [Niveibacterium sp. 24ML]
MKAFFKALLHPVVIGLLGLIAFALLIWFIGPLIAVAGRAPLESATVRLVLIGLVVLVVVGRYAYLKFKARKANAKLLDGLSGDAGEPAESPEVQVLRQRFSEGIAVLKQSRMGADKKAGAMARLASLGSSRYLYELPWYVFIGAPGSGKTTALINSGLRFPLADKLGVHQLKGIGGTRNCDWWFTDEAVLIDTAGRYTTQDSDQSADRSAWQGFLALLKKHRPRQPLNGVLLTVSLGDLLTQSGPAAAAHAAALRTRIQELYSELGVRLPVYVLVTKADLIAGFGEFFGDLGKEARDQVWGTTFPAETLGAPATDLAERLAGLQARVDSVFLERLQAERDLTRRGAIASFPQQFAMAGRLLREFLDQVLSPSGYDHTLMVRGVYFTSGTQEGNPIDRVLASLGGAFGLERRVIPPQAGTGKSFFLTRLLKEVVFAEQRLGGTNLKWERQRGLLRLAAFGGIGVLAVGLLLAWGMSFIGNRGYVAEVDARVAELKPIVVQAGSAPIDDVVGIIPVIGAVENVTHTATRPTGEMPFSLGFGLGQGDKLDAAAEQTFRGLLRDVLLPRISNRVEAQLRGSLDGNNLEFTYEALKTYLMLHQAPHFDGDALKAWIALDWERNLPTQTTSDQRGALAAYLDALFAQGPVASPVPADAALVAQARTRLLQFSLPARIYSRLKRQGVGSDIAEFTIDRAAGPSASLVFVRKSGQPLSKGVAGLYTYDGYYKGFDRELGRVSKQLVEEQAWVLGADAAQPGDAGKIAEEVRRLYLTDYIKVWEEFIADITLARSASLQQSIQVARVLSAPDSPLPKLLRAVSRETTLTRRAEDKTVVDKAGEKISGARQELGKMLGMGDAAPAAPTSAAMEAMVDERFAQIRALVTGDGKTAPIDAVTALLNDVYVTLTATETALRDKVAPPTGDTGIRVKAESARMPEPLRSMLQQLSAAGTSQALTATRENLSASVGAQVGQFCQQAIEGRYPFVKGSARDVTREDFARLFSPGGLMDDFFQKNLANFVDTSTRPWSFKKVQEQSLGGSGSLVQFQRAATIRDVFFRSGGSIRLDFKPIEMDPALTQFTLDVDGQLVRYAHGPQVLQSIQWPGAKGGLTARVQVAPAGPTGNSGFSTEGPWALFRLFDKAKVDGMGAPEKFKVVFDIDGRSAAFEVTASSVQNPFRLRELSEFRCPAGL